MSRPIRTYDVFDTLIARRGVEPDSVLRRLEARSGLPGLADARARADRALGARGRPYQLADIWREVEETLALDPDAARRLMDLEVLIEHEECIPIVENLARVRDGDLLVSDTYLPADVVRWPAAGRGRAGAVARPAWWVTNDRQAPGPRLRRLPRVLRRCAVGVSTSATTRTPTAGPPPPPGSERSSTRAHSAPPSSGS